MKRTIKRSALLVVAIAAFIVILLTPTLLISDLERALTLGAGIIGALSGFITIILGYIIYKDLGIDKVVTDKQVNTVIEFLEELKTIQLFGGAVVDGEIKTIIMGWSVSRFGVERKRPDYSEETEHIEYDKLLVVFDADNYFDKMRSLQKLKNSIWMPSELLKKFDVLSSPPLASTENDPKYSACMKIMINEKASLADTEKIWWSIGYEDDMTFERFYKILFDCCVEIEQWLQKNSKISVRLNL